jgi:hypothetical protein
MDKLNAKLLLGLLMVLSAALLIAGCSSSGSPSSTPPASSADIQAIADPIMENILVSLDQNNYATFSKDLSQAVKQTLNQTTFDQLYHQMQTSVGGYQSRLYVNNAVQNSLITVKYIAKYSLEPAGVTATLVLKSSNAGYEVQGLNFDSPNLRGQPLDVTQLRTYSDPETENILISINNNDYAGFSKDLDQVMKNTLPQSAFSQLYSQIKSSIGDYISKEFAGASANNDVTTVLYQAQYTDEPSGVWITISFNSDKKVAGLYFNSPKMLQSQSK